MSTSFTMNIIENIAAAVIVSIFITAIKNIFPQNHWLVRNFFKVVVVCVFTLSLLASYANLYPAISSFLANGIFALFVLSAIYVLKPSFKYLSILLTCMVLLFAASFYQIHQSLLEKQCSADFYNFYNSKYNLSVFHSHHVEECLKNEKLDYFRKKL